MEKKEKICIIGGSGSGKDFLLRKLTEKGLNPCLKWTTRPKRQHETQNITYRFVNDLKFSESINENKFLTHQKFNVTPENSSPQTWYYGITKEDFDKSQVFIMTPGEFSELSQDIRKGLFVVYLDIDISIRESRLYKRGDKNDSISRRILADEKDLENFKDYDLKITDSQFDVDMIYDLMC